MNNVKKIFMFLWNKKTTIIKYVFFALFIALFMALIRHNFNVIEQTKLGNYVKIIEPDAPEWYLHSKETFIFLCHICITIYLISLFVTFWCLYKKSKWAYWWIISPIILEFLAVKFGGIFF